MVARVIDKDSDLVAAAWCWSQTVMFVVTAVFGLIGGTMFYQTVVLSDYKCFLYNEMMVYHSEGSTDMYGKQLLDNDAWFTNEYCNYGFAVPIMSFVFSTIWIPLYVQFGRGGSVLPKSMADDNVFVGQWKIVFWSILFNALFWFKTLNATLIVTNGFWRFQDSVVLLPIEDEYRTYFNDHLKPAYYYCIALLWVLHASWAVSLVLSFCRCALGVDFEIEYDALDDDHKSAEDQFVLSAHMLELLENQQSLETDGNRHVKIK